MSKKKKSIDVMHKSGYEATVMPKYNPFQTGYGVHGETKHNRRKSKSATEREKKAFFSGDY